MKTFFKSMAAAFIATVLFAAALPALAMSPTLTINREGSGNNVRVTVYGDSYSQVTLYTRENSQLWTTITNFGQTDGSGYFSQVFSLGFAGSTSAEMYVTVNGQQSQTVQVSPGSNGCGYYGCGIGGLTLTPSSLSLYPGQSSTVQITSGVNMAAYPPYVSGNSNSGVASASVNGYQLNVTGNSSGSTTITVCLSGGSTCGTLYVTVSGSGSNNISLSQTNVSLNSGQGGVIYIYGFAVGDITNGRLNISSISDHNIVDAYLSSNSSGQVVMNMLGKQSGTATINVCGNYGSNCAAVYVTVSGNSYGNLSFTATSLPQAYVNQYYSSQFQLSGGTYPYNFMTVSGNLPAGLSLSSAGQIYGTPANTSSGSFTVRATDATGRSAYQNFTLTPACQSGYGCVQGSSTYNSGQLISENQTVYIVYKNTKIAFGNAEAFLGLGYNFGSVVPAGSSGLVDSGYVVSTSNIGHPWGTWIKAGSTIYFVHESGLIPVADYYAFTSNGGQDRYVVTANLYDFQRPMLSVMQVNDYRLR